MGEGFGRYLDAPLIALRKRLEAVINNQQGLYELVKQVDMKWGQMYGERPYFQSAGQVTHPEDEYTHESVRMQLIKLWEALNNAL